MIDLEFKVFKVIREWLFIENYVDEIIEVLIFVLFNMLKFFEVIREDEVDLVEDEFVCLIDKC